MGELDGLPRESERSLEPCALCSTQILASTLPIFYRLQVKHCGVDAQEINKRVGLAMTMGGGAGGLALASVMGPAIKPVVVMNERTVNVCFSCATDNPIVMRLAEAEADAICTLLDEAAKR